jgi:CRISPR-associated endoribonuclease Cas6
MKVILNLKFDKLLLPMNYNHILQGVVLKWIGDNQYGKFLHDQGYGYKNSKFKMYSFSNLLGKSKLLEDGRIKFFNKAKLKISSLDDKFLDYLIKNSIFKDKFNILDYEIDIDSFHTKSTDVSETEIRVKSHSPVTVYSTFKINNKKKTHYYHPKDKDFQDMAKNNLIKKYKAFYGSSPTNENIKIIPKGKHIMKIRRYKGFLIKGFLGEYEIKGNPELIKIALDTGIGSKNSQGFGYIEEVENARSYI